MDDAHPGRRSAIAAAACFAGVAVIAIVWFVFPSDETQIRRAIPAAAAIRRNVSANTSQMDREGANGLESLEDQSLTALLFLGAPTGQTLSPADAGTVDWPDPAHIIDELDGRRPATVIAERDITRFTCEVEGDRAHGTVEYEAKGLWRGRVQYHAEKRASGWTITEFRLPASRMGVRLDANGRWRFYSDPEP